jgi:hypothetical protein
VHEVRSPARSGLGGLLLLAVTACAGGSGTGATSPSASASSSVETTAAKKPDPAERCLAAARACSRNILAGMAVGRLTDALDCMPAEVIAQLGGRAFMEEAAHKAEEEFKRQQVVVLDYRMDAPSSVVEGGGILFAIVPSVIRVRVRDKPIEKPSYMLAVSRDHGESWRFVDGAGVTRHGLLGVYPELPPSLEIPEKKP